jgi:twitching motility protein PilT
LRVHGELKKLNHPPLTHDQNKALFTEIMSERYRNQFKGKCSRLRLSAGNIARFRSNVFMQRKASARRSA